MKDIPSSFSCVDKLKLLADPTRLAVLEHLMKKPRHVGELGFLLDVEQSLLSHHLAILREAGLVKATRKGKTVLYRLAQAVGGTAGGKALDLGCCQLSFTSPSRKGKRP